MAMADVPSLRTKLFFWFILSAFSVFFAEVVSGSYPMAFFNPFNPADIWGWIALMPLYGLHTLVLASVIFSGGRPKFYALFLAGAIFGLYEAYITKVLWNPGWGAVWHIGGVAVVELFVIALFWHPFMSFIIPLTAGEATLTASTEIFDGMPAWMRRWLTSRNIAIVFILFAVWAGMTHGGQAPFALHTLLSSLISAGFLLGLVYLWKRRTAKRSYSMRSLLPNLRQAAVLLVPLLAIYLLFGIGMFPDRIPGVWGQAPVWALYGLLFALLYFAIRRSDTDTVPIFPLVRPRIDWKWMTVFFGVFTVVSVLWNLTGLSVLVLVLSWFPGFFIGAYFIQWSAREALAGTAKIYKRGGYPVSAQGATGR
jgi:hypothetical protein